MPDTTGSFPKPYPNSSDIPDGPAAFLALGLSVDGDLTGQVAEWRVADATARAALSGMRAGDRALQVDTGITYRYSGSAWVAWSSPWISYTPTLTNLAVGTGGSAFNAAEYKFTDGEPRVRGRFVMGSSGASVGSQPRIGLPSGMAMRAPVVANESLMGSVTLFDQGVAVNHGFARYFGTDTDKFELQQNAATAAGAASITASSPWTWSASGSADAIEYDVFPKLAA